MAIIGLGTKLERVNSDNTYDIYHGLTSITPPSGAADEIEKTSYESPGGYKEYLTDYFTAGDVALEFNFVANTFRMLKEDFDNDKAVKYRITMPDAPEEGGTGTIIEFEGLVTAVDANASVGNKMTLTATIKVTGEPKLVGSKAGLYTVFDIDMDMSQDNMGSGSYFLKDMILGFDCKLKKAVFIVEDEFKATNELGEAVVQVSVDANSVLEFTVKDSVHDVRFGSGRRVIDVMPESTVEISSGSAISVIGTCTESGGVYNTFSQGRGKLNLILEQED